MEEVGLGVTGMAWNKGIWFLPDWNGLDWRKSISTGLEGLRMEENGLGRTGIAWNGRSQFWPDWNSLEWKKSVLA
jgi:hypothetical protein